MVLRAASFFCVASKGFIWVNSTTSALTKREISNLFRLVREHSLDFGMLPVT